MTLIVVIIIAMYILLIAWTWNNLGEIEKSKKILVIAVGILVMYLITSILFFFSKSGINYEKILIEKSIKNIIVAIFTGINSFIVLPFMAKQFYKVHEGEIEQKEFKKKVAIIVIIFIICILFERGYMKDTQQGIMRIYNSKIK